MALTPEREQIKTLAIMLSGINIKYSLIAEYLNIPEGTIKYWLAKKNASNFHICITNYNGKIVHNSGIEVGNFRDGLPPNPKPQLFVGKAENLYSIPNESVDIIITSPPYNLGQEKWPMGGNGRTPRDSGIGYSDHGDDMPEEDYQKWQGH